MSTIDLNNLCHKRQWLSEHYTGYAAEAASVCLEHFSHPSPVSMAMEGALTTTHDVVRLSVDDDMVNTHYEKGKRGEFGAEAIAILLIAGHTPYNVGQRSALKTGMDFYLIDKKARFFQKDARVEISGTHLKSQFASRIRQKSVQISASDSEGTRAFIIVVDFETPRCYVNYYVPPNTAPAYP